MQVAAAEIAAAAEVEGILPLGAKILAQAEVKIT
jgi:hypothetical protein